MLNIRREEVGGKKLNMEELNNSHPSLDIVRPLKYVEVDGTCSMQSACDECIQHSGRKA
jgi:hypothetical protein